MSFPTWLPTALKRADFADESTLELAALAVFKKNFKSPIPFRGELVHISRRPHPARPDREHTYWHAVTEGKPERLRTHKICRMECLPWIKPLIENERCPHSAIKVWSNRRRGDSHICLWFDRLNFLVILKPLRRDNYLLITAYRPRSNRKKQLHREYAAWKKNGARL